MRDPLKYDDFLRTNKELFKKIVLVKEKKPRGQNRETGLSLWQLGMP